MYYLFAVIFKKLFFGSTFHYHCDSETVAIWFKIVKWFCWNKHLCHFKYVLIKCPTVCSTSSVCVSKSLHSRNECWRNRMLSADMCHSVISATHPAGCCRHTGAQTNFTLTNTNIQKTHTPKYTHTHTQTLSKDYCQSCSYIMTEQSMDMCQQFPFTWERRGEEK